MQLLQYVVRFWSLVWLMQLNGWQAHLVVSDDEGGDRNQQLIDFVGQIKASHLGNCTGIEIVQLEHESLWGREWFTFGPVYTSNDYQSRGAPGISCAIVSTTLSSRRNFTGRLFSSKAKLIYLIDAGHGTPLGATLATELLLSHGKKTRYNTIAVLYNSTSFEGYFFEPIRQLATIVSVPNRPIYPTLVEFRDLQGFVLHLAYIPGESDRVVIGIILQTLASARNGSIAELAGLQASGLLEFSRHLQWQFSLLAVGPTEHATCFFVPWAGLIPIGYILVEPFDTGTWISVVLVACVVVLLLKFFGQDAKGSFATATITLLQNVFTSPNRVPRSAFERRILASCSLGCLVLVSSYLSVIFSLISNPAFYPELDTERQINRSCSLLVAPVENLAGFDSFRDSFSDRGSFRSGISCLATTCRLEPLIAARPHLASVYRASRHRTHPFPMLVALMDSHYEPFDALIGHYLSGFFETGITQKLLADRRRSRDGVRRCGNRCSSKQQLKVSDLHIVWIVLEVGLGCSVLCFLAELAIFHRAKVLLFKRKITWQGR